VIHHRDRERVIPGESVLVVSPEAAAAQAESAWVIAGNDTLPVTVVNDSTVATAPLDTAYAAEVDLVLQTPGGLLDLGTVHQYGFVGAKTLDGFVGEPIEFPDGFTVPSVAVFDANGPAIVNVETGAVQRAPGPSPWVACFGGLGSYQTTGIGPSYRSDRGWVATCNGSFRLIPLPGDSIPVALNGRLVAEIGPSVYMMLSKYDLQVQKVDSTGALTNTAISNEGIIESHHVAISPRGDLAIPDAAPARGLTSATSYAIILPGLPVFGPDGTVAYMLYGTTEHYARPAFSPTGDTIFVAAVPDLGANVSVLTLFAASDGTVLDSLVLPAEVERVLAPPSSRYLYAMTMSVIPGSPLVRLLVIDRQRLILVSELIASPDCLVGVDPTVLVAAPGHHAVFAVMGTAIPYYMSNQVTGPLNVCRFDVP
ncbi:MAG TPA: hypothetical protein VJ992_00180, partial [Gemmatimonadales bacterium]|nr:hypothetical protein [Gemmatimonadales bacterium]